MQLKPRVTGRMTQHTPSQLTDDAPLVQVANRGNCRTSAQRPLTWGTGLGGGSRSSTRCAKFCSKDRADPARVLGNDWWNSSCAERVMVLIGDRRLKQCKLEVV